jgi:hypothetical protein
MAQLCVYWRFNEVQAGKVLDASGNNNFGLLNESSNVSIKALGVNQPMSDEDEWGEKVQMGHSLIGEIVCNEIHHDETVSSATVELYVSRVSSVDINDSSSTFLALNGSACMSLTKQAEIVVEIDGVQHVTSKRLVLNEWTHVALVLTSSKGELFVNSSPILSIENERPVDQTWSLTLGSNITEITEVRIWSCARTEAEIRQYISVCLPRAAPVSRWKGMRINMKPDASSRSWAKPIPDEAIVPSTRTRRIFEEPVFTETKEASPKKETPQPLESVEDVSETSPQKVTSTEIDVKNEGIQPVEAVVQIPDESQPELIEPQATLVARTSTSVEVPLLIPSALPDALAFFDSLLESAILGRGLEFDKRKLESIVRGFSSFIRSQYRIGPYLAPMPPEALLVRLKIATTYLGLTNVLNNTSAWGTLVALRLPLLREHIPLVLMRSMEECKIRGDQVSVSMLTRALKNDYGTDFTPEQLDQVGRYLALSVSGTRTSVTCPFCANKLRDPLQTSCSDGCGTRFAVCYITGNVVAFDDCARCRVCSTSFSVKLTGAMSSGRGNVPTNIKMSFPPACYVCGCLGSLVPIA